MRRLILFVEGEGESDAVPTLVRRLIKEKGEWYDILLDDAPFRVGSVDKLVKKEFSDWKRFLGASLKRPDVGGVLLILDATSRRSEAKSFARLQWPRHWPSRRKMLGRVRSSRSRSFLRGRNSKHG
jgi:hypothetical protein